MCFFHSFSLPLTSILFLLSTRPRCIRARFFLSPLMRFAYALSCVRIFFTLLFLNLVWFFCLRSLASSWSALSYINTQTHTHTHLYLRSPGRFFIPLKHKLNESTHTHRESKREREIWAQLKHILLDAHRNNVYIFVLMGAQTTYKIIVTKAI